MIMKNFKKCMALIITTMSVIVFNSVGASAEWKHNDWGWRYAEGDSWAKGWKEVDGKWYYFQPTSSYMLRDQTIEGYRLGHDGAWIVGASADSIGTYGTKFEFDKYTGTIRSYFGNDTKIIVPDTIDGIAVKSIGAGSTVYMNFGGKFSVVLPSSLTSIGEKAFFNNYGLTSVNIPDGVTSIGKFAFCNVACTNINLPNGVTSIGDSAFAGCEELTSITIPNSVTSIGRNAFKDSDSAVLYVSSESIKQLLISNGVDEDKIIVKG